MTPLLDGLKSLAISHIPERQRDGFKVWFEIAMARNTNMAKAISETYHLAPATCHGNPPMEYVSELKGYVYAQGIPLSVIEGAIRYSESAKGAYLALLYLLWKDNE